jgi:hypothetical protein
MKNLFSNSEQHASNVAGMAAQAALGLRNLPPQTITRWTARYKAAVVEAIRQGALSTAEACYRYGLSKDELLEWNRHFEMAGVKGLEVGAFLRRLS